MASPVQNKEGSSYKIFVGGLDLDTTEEDLTQYFSKFGTVVEHLIKVDLKTKKSRGFGFVGFKSSQDVDRVLDIPEHRIKNKKIDCKRAMTKEEAYSLNKNLKETCRKVYVSNIPKEISKDDLLNFFNKYGEVIEINLMFKKKETGFCYLIFKEENAAVELINRGFVEVKGQKLEVKKAIPKELKDGPEEDTRVKQSNQYFPQQPVKHHRHSFDVPVNYTPFYSNPPVPPGHGVSHAGKYGMYGYYPAGMPPAPGANMGTHRVGDPGSPYDRPRISSNNPIHFEDSRFQPPPFGPYPGRPMPQFAGTEGIYAEKQPHRTRVMSEQQINTYKPFNSQGAMAPPGIDTRSPPTKTFQQGQSFTQFEEARYPTTASPPQPDRKYFSHSLVELHDNADKHSPGNRSTPLGNQTKPQPQTQPELNFYENDFNFKNQFPKESTATQKKTSLSPGKRNEDSRGREDKYKKIRQIEEEIRVTKEKLKSLEEMLRKENETVEEDASDKEHGYSETSPRNNQPV